MVNPTKYELKFIAKNRDIKNYQNMSKEELLSTLDKLEPCYRKFIKKWVSANCKNAESFTEGT